MPSKDCLNKLAIYINPPLSIIINLIKQQQQQTNNNNNNKTVFYMNIHFFQHIKIFTV